MTFDVAATAYDRFMGRFSVPLAARFADQAGVQAEQHVLDVGCGPGALTGELVRRLGADHVAALDPSPPFVAAARARFPDVDVRRGAAESLPYADGEFDLALAQLVVHFMADPAARLTEMVRVTRPSGIVAACVWDHGGGTGPLSLFWRAVHDLDPAAAGESDLAGARDGQLAGLFESAGLSAIETAALSVTVTFQSADDWWDPYTLGVGPAGAYVNGLDPLHREALKSHCAELLPAAPFDVTASAWFARGTRQTTAKTSAISGGSA